MAKKEFKKGEIVIYKTSQNEVELKVYFEKENIWLTQNQIALLFGTQRPAITKHLKNIFQSGELEEKMVSSILEHTTAHGSIKGKTQTILVVSCKTVKKGLGAHYLIPNNIEKLVDLVRLKAVEFKYRYKFNI